MVNVWDVRNKTDDGMGAGVTVDLKSPVLAMVWGRKYCVLTSHSDGSIKQVDTRMGRVVSVTNAHANECRSLDISPCGNHLLSAAFDSQCSVFGIQGENMPQPSFQAAMRTGGGRLLAARWQRYGEPGIVIAGADCSVTFWRMGKRIPGDEYGVKVGVGVGVGVVKS